ncbi:hypothetical protein JL09_g5647 [Pichia kudriavzevii]|uniref:Uncharacterized protein n=1 Tax=Pichia kudriavzevii TaxID=4909 RepID=A0A099NQY1_PICKU|nr:hypothetical protein JL09_g5647 [Pichia kudriavzevii]
MVNENTRIVRRKQGQSVSSSILKKDQRIVQLGRKNNHILCGTVLKRISSTSHLSIEIKQSVPSSLFLYPLYAFLIYAYRTGTHCVLVGKSGGYTYFCPK